MLKSYVLQKTNTKTDTRLLHLLLVPNAATMAAADAVPGEKARGSR